MLMMALGAGLCLWLFQPETTCKIKGNSKAMCPVLLPTVEMRKGKENDAE